jgi:hypothetical protein
VVVQRSQRVRVRLRKESMRRYDVRPAEDQLVEVVELASVLGLGHERNALFRVFNQRVLDAVNLLKDGVM